VVLHIRLLSVVFSTYANDLIGLSLRIKDSKSFGSLSLRHIGLVSRRDLLDFSIGRMPALRYEISQIITED